MNKPQTIVATVEQVTTYTLTIDTNNPPIAGFDEFIGNDWSGENLRRVASDNLDFIIENGQSACSEPTLTALSATVRVVTETTDLLADTPDTEVDTDS